MKERVKFVLEWERQWELGEGRVNVTALCAGFGISRDTGYRWIARYEAAGRKVDALEERSHRPHRSPNAVRRDIEELVVASRRKFPKWGPRKLREFLSKKFPDVRLPAPSTIGAILERHMLSRPRKLRRAKVPAYTQPFAKCTAPNMVWCVDFKGHFRCKNGQRVYPLTIMDAFSRFLIRCSIVLNPDGIEVERVFESAFREFGRPAAIRSDNGPPFASKAAGGLSSLSVWWICLGIVPERIEPGRPDQNGRHERMHRTLKEHTATPPASTPAAQQRAFDKFMKEYNYLRPHEALGMQTPAAVHKRSNRTYPIPSTSPPQRTLEQALVSQDGTISFGRKRRVFIAKCLYGRYIGLDPVSHRSLNVVFGPVHLGYIDLDALANGLIQPGRRGYRDCEKHIQMYESSYTSGEKRLLDSNAMLNSGQRDEGFEGPRADQNEEKKVSGISSV